MFVSLVFYSPKRTNKFVYNAIFYPSKSVMFVYNSCHFEVVYEYRKNETLCHE